MFLQQSGGSQAGISSIGLGLNENNSSAALIQTDQVALTISASGDYRLATQVVNITTSGGALPRADASRPKRASDGIVSEHSSAGCGPNSSPPTAFAYEGVSRTIYPVSRGFKSIPTALRSGILRPTSFSMYM